MIDDTFSYSGLCNICGHKGVFTGSARNSRESFPCEKCKASLRYREQAAAILSQFGAGQHHFLSRFVRATEVQALHVYEAALRGPLHRQLKHLPHYTQSYLFEDIPIGTKKKNIVCENLERLTFRDESFHLVVTSDVLEHVADVDAVIREVHRVLRPGGAHIFSIPMTWPLPKSSRTRAVRQNGEIVHLMEERYHQAGDGGKSLVFTEFGSDLIGRHAKSGMRARLRRTHGLIKGLHRYACVVAVKVGHSPDQNMDVQ